MNMQQTGDFPFGQLNPGFMRKYGSMGINGGPIIFSGGVFSMVSGSNFSRNSVYESKLRLESSGLISPGHESEFEPTG